MIGIGGWWCVNAVGMVRVVHREVICEVSMRMVSRDAPLMLVQLSFLLLLHGASILLAPRVVASAHRERERERAKGARNNESYDRRPTYHHHRPRQSRIQTSPTLKTPAAPRQARPHTDFSSTMWRDRTNL